MSRMRPNRKHALNQRLSRQLRQALCATLVRHDSPDAADSAALLIERSAGAVAPPQMAQSHPGSAASRAEARALYERCLVHYRAAACTRDDAFDDVGAAAAAFVAANLQALHGLCATAEMLSRLERQLGVLLRSSPAWAAAGLHEQQFFFEQLAILAVLVGEASILALHQEPAAIANVQRAAHGYLQRFLGINPAVLSMGSNGLALRAAGVAQPAT